MPTCPRLIFATIIQLASRCIYTVFVVASRVCLGESAHPYDHAHPLPSEHGTLTFISAANITRVYINNPPVNFLTVELITDLYSFLLWTVPGPSRTTPKVVVFSSTVPSFFISHFDLRNQYNSTAGRDALFRLISCGRLLQSTTSTAFIAQINGRTFRGCQELASQMDMRFAGPDALVAQYENSNGFVAHAGGQSSLGLIIGKARALEHLLASRTIDAPIGIKNGLFNNWYKDAEMLERNVGALAARIGLFPQTRLNDTKFSLAFMSPTDKMLDAQV